MTKYFLEVSDLVPFVQNSSTLSGIQRVVVNVARKLAEKHGTENVYLCCFDSDEENSEYRVLSSRLLLDMEQFDVDTLRAALVPNYEVTVGQPEFLKKYQRSPGKLKFHTLRAQFYAKFGSSKYFKKRNTTRDEWNDYILEREEYEPEEIIGIREKYYVGKFEAICEPGDRLCILGAMWSNAKAKEYGLIAKGLGAKVSVLIYDLIPLTNPELAADELSAIFSTWIHDTTEYVDQYLAISDHAAREMSQFLSEVGHSQNVRAVPLVQQFVVADAPARRPASIRSRLGEISDIGRSVLRHSDRPYVLSVGTMESRKNFLGLAQAWDFLLRENIAEMPRLIIAGRKGWHNEAFFDWIEQSSSLGGWVSIIEQPTDRELAYLYKNCEFSAMVSFAEGWGLPIGESLSYGKTAVVANNSSMPEVGEDMVEYCDARYPGSIANACRKLITEPAHREVLEDRIRSRRLRTWDDVADDFVGALT